MRTWLTTLAVLGAAAAAVAGGEACRQAAEAKPPEPGSVTFNRFLFFAAFEGACEDGLSEEAVEAILEKDGEGRLRNFVHGCPVCHPVADGLRAYGMRARFCLDSKGEPLAGPPSAASVKAMERLASSDAHDRGAALKGLVEGWVKRRMDRLRLTEKERAAWNHSMEVGMKKGTGMLPSSEGFAHKACPSCDGASGVPSVFDR